MACDARLMCAGAALLLASCAPTTQRATISQAEIDAEARRQMEVLVQEKLAREIRVSTIEARISAAGAPLCGERVRSFVGFAVMVDRGYGTELQEAARRALGLDESPRVVHVYSGSPLADKGIERGAVVSAVNGQAIGQGPGAVKDLGRMLRQARTAPVTMTIGGRDITVTPVPVCDYPVRISTVDAINAMADGNKVVLTTGMTRFTRDDGELALVISHEISHNLMGHIDAKMVNAIPGLIADILLGAMTGVNTQGAFTRMAASAYSKEFEAEADYVGLYLMARAGYEIDNAPYFWRRMGTASPKSISHATSHPTTAYRFVALDKAVAEIKQKMAANLPLEPNLKKPPSPRQRTGAGGAEFGSDEPWPDRAEW